MGCGGSKKGKKERCDMTMEPTGNSDIDALFTNMAGPLTTLADVVNTLKKGENKMRRRTHAYLLKNCTLEDSVTAMLYGLSGETNGDFDKIELKIVVESPYIKISKHKVDEEYHEVIEAWNYLMEKLISATEQLAELPSKINDMVEEAKGLPDRAKTICETAGLNVIEMAKTIRIVTSNVGKVCSAPKVLAEAKTMFESLINTCKGLDSKMDHEGREKIHSVGKKIHEAKVRNMREVIVQYWPDKTRIDIKLERPRKGKHGAPAHK
jgi:prefoldin subunit 5